MVLPFFAKFDVYSVFHQFQTFVQRQFSLKIKFVKKQYISKYRKLSTFFQTIGIHYCLICPHTHEQNGTVEHHHRYIVKTCLTLLGLCKTTLRFWNYAFEMSIYLINRMPTLVLDNRSYFDCLFQWSLDYHLLCTFGCLCYLFMHPYHNHKLEFCSSLYMFFGYSSSHLGYRCLAIASQCIYISCHVCFHEHVFSFDKSIEIAQSTSHSFNHSNLVFLPNLLISLLFHSYGLHSPFMCSSFSYTYFCSLAIAQHFHLVHNHMYVYLTIMLQVQVQVRPPLLCNISGMLLLVLLVVPLLLPYCLPITALL